jgi:quinol monooxygenase YgiN
MGVVAKELERMKYLVVADFRCKPGMVRRMAELFEDALPVTRSFQGCRSIAVYYEERTLTFTLLEDWDSLEEYEAYLSFREDTGIQTQLDPLLDGGWAGVKASVKRLGKIQPL